MSSLSATIPLNISNDTVSIICSVHVSSKTYKYKTPLINLANNVYLQFGVLSFFHPNQLFVFSETKTQS